MSRVIFKGGNVLDGSGSQHLGTTVVVAGDRIESVGNDPIPAANGDRVIHLAGMSLLPGMVTGHGHIELGQPASGPEGVKMALAIMNCRAMLDSGFTSYVSAGVSYNIDAQLKAAIDAQLMVGPRILAGGRRLNTTAYVNDTTPWWQDLENTPDDVYVNGPEEIREAVRTQVRQGTEMIKIFPTAGRGFKLGRCPGMSRDELQAVVDAAHGRNVKVRAHCVWIEQIRDCLDAGVDLIDHGDELDEKCVAQMVDQGTYWVPSMGLPATRGLSHPSVIEKDWRNIANMLPFANDAGVKILAGDDYGVPDIPHAPGIYSTDLIVAVSEFGIKPMDALKWATWNGASIMGMEGEIGTISVGALADLVVVAGDPSSDLSLLSDPSSNIPAVMKDGVFIKDSL
jgi:imidazolonepropionase-like amidohydrolase